MTKSKRRKSIEAALAISEYEARKKRQRLAAEHEMAAADLDRLAERLGVEREKEIWAGEVTDKHPKGTTVTAYPGLGVVFRTPVSSQMGKLDDPLLVETITVMEPGLLIKLVTYLTRLEAGLADATVQRKLAEEECARKGE